MFGPAGNEAATRLGSTFEEHHPFGSGACFRFCMKHFGQVDLIRSLSVQGLVQSGMAQFREILNRLRKEFDWRKQSMGNQFAPALRNICPIVRDNGEAALRQGSRECGLPGAGLSRYKEPTSGTIEASAMQ